MTNAKHDRTERRIRHLVGYAWYIVCAGVAAAVVTWYDLWAYSTPFLFVFLLGYLAGRISKGIER